MGPEEGTGNQAKIETLRQALTNNLLEVADIKSTSTPPVVQEVILAQRAIENARMRLGVALAYVNGQDPWSTK